MMVLLSETYFVRELPFFLPRGLPGGRWIRPIIRENPGRFFRRFESNSVNRREKLLVCSQGYQITHDNKNILFHL